VTITTSADGKTSVVASTSDASVSSASGQLSQSEIDLVRQTWDIARDIPTVATRTLLE